MTSSCIIGTCNNHIHIFVDISLFVAFIWRRRAVVGDVSGLLGNHHRLVDSTWWNWNELWCHYSDVIMGTMVSQITSLTIVSSKPRITGLCAGNSPVTCEFPAQMASNAENVSIWWRHHVVRLSDVLLVLYLLRHHPIDIGIPIINLRRRLTVLSLK